MSKPFAEFAVGEGATMGFGSDCYPYTIIQVVSEKKVVIQADRSKLVSGNILTEAQEYEYSRDPNGTTLVVTKRKNGKWYPQGQSMNSQSVYLGGRRAYRDPSF
jgi:hypothetical protein